jgi:hypothetical protein
MNARRVENVLRLWGLRGAAAKTGDGVLRPRLGAGPGVVIALLCIAAWAGIDRQQAGPDAQFFTDNVPLLAWYGLGAVGLAGLLAACTRQRAGLADLITLITAWMPLPLLLAALAVPYLDPAWLYAVLAAGLAYTIAYFFRGLALLTGRREAAAATLAVFLVLGFIGLSDVLDVVPAMWMPQEADGGDARQSLQPDEQTLFEQSARIDAALDSLVQDPKAPARGYFLGFAGVGDERVFTQEIGLAARVLGARYHLDERSLSLVNDERDLDSAPLASVWALRYALSGLAERMNLDRDVLFLSISSHGAPQPAIIVSNSDLPLQDLTARDLKDALDESGIRWRVIVISACYAGGFVESLRDPHTIVITAAAPDRTSFGCGSDSELTYFGSAFYRDALPDATSLRAAFDSARAAIAEREKREHVDPSEPLAWFGSALEQKLSAWH